MMGAVQNKDIKKKPGYLDFKIVNLTNWWALIDKIGAIFLSSKLILHFHEFFTGLIANALINKTFLYVCR